MEKSIRILSVNVGQGRDVESSGRMVRTGIFKSPVEGPVRAVGVNLEGDDQADRTVHGGPDKAIYAFPSEHYSAWREEFPESDRGWGAFGENLTTSGLLEQQAVIGAVYRCGELELRVTEPRMPCFKLSIRLDNKKAVKQMLETGHTGYYFAIEKEGAIQVGDVLELVSEPEKGLPVTALTDLYAAKQPPIADLERALQAPAVTQTWRDWIEEKIEKRAS